MKTHLGNPVDILTPYQTENWTKSNENKNKGTRYFHQKHTSSATASFGLYFPESTQFLSRKEISFIRSWASMYQTKSTMKNLKNLTPAVSCDLYAMIYTFLSK